MAAAGATTPSVGTSTQRLFALVADLFARLDVKDDTLLATCVETLASQIAPAQGELTWSEMIPLKDAIKATLPPAKQAAFDEACSKLSAKRTPNLGGLLQVLARIGDNQSLKRVLAMAARNAAGGGDAPASVARTAGPMTVKPPAGPQPHFGGRSLAVTAALTSTSSDDAASIAESLQKIRLQGTRFGMSGETLPPSSLVYNSVVYLRCAASCAHLAAGATGEVLVDTTSAGTDPQLMVIQNAAFREDTGPVLMGDSILLRSLRVDKMLGVDMGKGTLRFAKSPNMVSHGEKWIMSEPSDRTAHRGDSIVFVGDRIRLATSAGLFLHIQGSDTDGYKAAAALAQSTAIQVTVPRTFEWYVVPAGTTFLPEWNRKRPALVGTSFITDSSVEGEDIPLGRYPSLLQEQLVVDELLNACLGLEGSLIRLKRADSGLTGVVEAAEFELVAIDLDAGIASVASRVLDVCRDYVRARWFVEVCSRPESGLVAQALGAAIRVLLQEYTLLIAQLESLSCEGRLSLQKLQFYLQPSMKTMSGLVKLVEEARGTCGGAMLNKVLKAQLTEGDPQNRALCAYLLERASVPFLQMLEAWIFRGFVEDPHEEFMIRQRKELTKDTMREDFNSNYWERRYTVKPEQVPTFLASLEQTVLITGKYLNVLRECGSVIMCPTAAPISFSADQRHFSHIVQQAFDFASRTLLDHLLVNAKILERLSSIKRYFLLAQGDFLVHFMELAQSELGKPVEIIGVGRLQSLLELAIRTSNAATDEFKDEVSCVMETSTLVQRLEAIHQSGGALGDGPHSTAPAARVGTLKGIDAFALDYTVQWPVSIVLSKRAITQYQLLFRHLFFCKHVERQLCRAWLGHQATKELRLTGAFSQWTALRHRMLHFIQNLIYYMMTEVIEPRWREMQAAVATVTTVDQLIKVQQDFLDSCLKECLLTSQDLVSVVTKLTTVCLLFAEQSLRMVEDIVDSEDRDMALFVQEQIRDTARATGKKPSSAKVQSETRQARIDARSATFDERLRDDSYVRSFARSSQIFDQFMADLLRQLRTGAGSEYKSHLAHLCTRLSNE